MFRKQPDQSALRQSVGRQETRQYDNAFASFAAPKQNQRTVRLEISFHRNCFGAVKNRPSVAEPELV